MYPQSDNLFVVYTDANGKQIGGLVTQDSKDLVFFCKKLTNVQSPYPVTVQELLAVVETLKYFKQILLGHAITMHTDHKNLTHPHPTIFPVAFYAIVFYLRSMEWK
jgi:hypothetical protein